MTTLTRLTLGHFRNYESLSWQPGGRIVVIAGQNGSGKTNLLEAISLLAPGRGLRGAKIPELARNGSGAWAVHGRLSSADGPTEIGTGTTDEAPERRIFRLDGSPPRNQAEIAARIATVWLTPQMDRLFQEGASGRRRFLDRLVYAVEPGQAREVASYEAATASRNRLLAEGRRDPAWLAGLEDAMARHGVAATAARRTLIADLNTLLAAGVAGEFPAARLDLVSPIADRLAEAPALAVEEWLRGELQATRPRDAAAGAALLGAHKDDLALSDLGSLRPAALCSTGEQKSLLIGTILGHAALIARGRGNPPLLLLDEPTTHLDIARRNALFAALGTLACQVFLTGTDAEIFAPLKAVAHGEAMFWGTGLNALHAGS